MGFIFQNFYRPLATWRRDMTAPWGVFAIRTSDGMACLTSAHNTEEEARSALKTMRKYAGHTYIVESQCR